MKQSFNWKAMIGSALVGIVIGGLTVVGANQTIQAIQNTELKVTLNNMTQEFKDETTGETQYPLTYHDRTYLPLRTVANLVGVDVRYDERSNTAELYTPVYSYCPARDIRQSVESIALYEYGQFRFAISCI